MSNNLLASASHRQIAPSEPVELGCSNSGRLKWRGIESPIEANALALWESEDELPLLFITLDLLYPGRLLRTAIEAAAFPLPAERIIVAASHTHRAPMTDDTKSALGMPHPRYIRWLTDQLTSLVKETLDGARTPAKLSVGEGTARHSINRRLRKRFMLARRPRINEVVNAPNPAGPTDELLTVLSIRDLEDNPLAVIWNYACHPVDGPTLNAISGHFPTDVREHLRSEERRPELPVLFFQGFSGNTRPSATAHAHSWKRRVRQFVSGPLFESMTRDRYSEWVESLTKVVTSTLRSALPLDSVALHSQRVTVPADHLVRSEQDLEKLSLARIDIGDKITMLTVSAEPVVEYAHRVRNMLPARHVICIGCADHVIGYIPTKKIQAEGGYEAGGFCRAFGLEGLDSEIESTFMGAIKLLLQQRKT